MSPHAEEKARVAIIGTFQVGKSTLVNCLLADELADMAVEGGEGLPTTHVVSTWRHGDTEEALLFHDRQCQPLHMDLAQYSKLDRQSDKVFRNLDRKEFVLNRECLRWIDLRDTPGLDAAGQEGELDKQRTMEAVGREEVDFLLVLVWAEQLPQGVLSELGKVMSDIRKPFAVVMNCLGNPRCQDCEGARRAAEAQLDALGLSPVPVAGGQTVWTCNLAWYLWARIGDRHGGRYEGKLKGWRDDLERSFPRGGLGKPTWERVAEQSAVQPLVDFVTGGGTSFAPLPARVALHREAAAWRASLRGLVQKACR